MGAKRVQDRIEPVLVVGGTGKTGRRVAGRLLAPGLTVRIGTPRGARRSTGPTARCGRRLSDHASMEVVADGDKGSRLLWVADVAPDEAAPAVGEFMHLGADAIRRTLDGASASAAPRR